MNLSHEGNEHVSIGFHSRREQRLFEREIFRPYLPSPVERCRSMMKSLWRGNPNLVPEIRVPYQELPSVRDSAEQQGRAIMSEFAAGSKRAAPELILMSHAVAKMNDFIVRTSVAPEIIS